MPRIPFAEAFIQIDGRLIAEIFSISIAELESGMEDGSIPYRIETGNAPKAGELELIFTAKGRQARVITTRQGKILSCLEEPQATPPASISTTEQSPSDQRAQQEAERRAHLDRLLDEALADSFPASDPISIFTD